MDSPALLQLKALMPTPPPDSLPSGLGNIVTSDDRTRQDRKQTTSLDPPPKKSPRVLTESSIHVSNGCYRATSNKVIHYQDPSPYQQGKSKASPLSNLERGEKAHSARLVSSDQGASLSWFSTLFSRRKTMATKGTKHNFDDDTNTSTTTTDGGGDEAVGRIATDHSFRVETASCHGSAANNGDVVTSTNSPMIGIDHAITTSETNSDDDDDGVMIDEDGSDRVGTRIGRVNSGAGENSMVHGGSLLTWESPRSSSWEQLSAREKPTATTIATTSTSYTHHSCHVNRTRSLLQQQQQEQARLQGPHNQVEQKCPLGPIDNNTPPYKPCQIPRKVSLLRKLWSSSLNHHDLAHQHNPNLHSNPSPNFTRSLNLNPKQKLHHNHNKPEKHKSETDETIASPPAPLPSLSPSTRASEPYHQTTNNNYYYYSSSYYNTIINSSSFSSSFSSSASTSTSTSSLSSLPVPCLPSASRPNTPRAGAGTGTSRPTTPRTGSEQGLLRLYLAPNVFTFRARNRQISRHRRCLSQI